MNTLRLGLFIQTILLASIFAASCNKPKKSSSSPAPTADAQRQECEARGENFRWDMNQCVPLKTDEQLCNERPGYAWTNGRCEQSVVTPQDQCLQNGGQWINGTCVGGNSINQLNGCQSINTVPGAMNCIQVRANEMEAYLKTRGGFSWYNNVNSDLDTIREKNIELKEAQIQSLENLTFLKKQALCWDLKSMSIQKSNISTKLRLSGEGELDRAEPYLNNFETSLEHTKQLVGCNSIVY